MSKALGVVIKGAPKKTKAVKKKAADSSGEEEDEGSAHGLQESFGKEKISDFIGMSRPQTLADAMGDL